MTITQPQNTREGHKMTLWFQKNWRDIAVAAVLVSAVGLSLGKLATCTIPAAVNSNLNVDRGNDPLTHKRSIGERTMFSFARTQSKVEHATEANFHELVLNSDVPVLVDFYADWCGPCRMIAPLLDEIASEEPDAKVVKVNVDHNPQLAAQYGISSIPSLKVIKGGKVVAQHVGMADKASLKALMSL